MTSEGESVERPEGNDPEVRRPFFRLLGEDGEMLTILSLLGPAPADAVAQSKPLGEMTLEEAVARIAELAGREGQAATVLSLRRAFQDPSTDAFSAEQDVPLARLSDQLRRLVGDRSDAVVVLSRLSAADEGRFEEEEVEESPHPLREAVHRFVEALKHLFNAAGEGGEPLTILSLLVRQGAHEDDRRAT